MPMLGRFLQECFLTFNGNQTNNLPKKRDQYLNSSKEKVNCSYQKLSNLRIKKDSLLHRKALFLDALTSLSTNSKKIFLA